MLNAGIGYKPSLGPGETTLSLRARNLLDADARRHNSFLKEAAPLTGRSLLFSLRASF